MARDWQEWHRGYDDPQSSLSNRLDHVVALIRRCLDVAAPGPIRVLSLCAGDARDLAGAVADHPRRADVVGCVVELDPQLAADAASNISSAGLPAGVSVGAAVEVRCTDAGDVDSFADAVPADLVLLAGIFGNVSDDDVRRTVMTAPRLGTTGSTVIWTRHRREPDLTPSIRAWFDEAGCESVDLISPGAGAFAIGCEHVVRLPPDTQLPSRLFTFRDDLW
ncbi:MAG: SAM-dependent methyltransferase [Ilumatobacteraceae bacterium]|nr:SAM-dependent methyltransferase [Ilumatobacteraceae bacterium]